MAYTVGQDVVFGAGQYAPGTEAGRRLLAHELSPISHSRSPNGDQAVREGIQTIAEEREARSTSTASPRLGHDFSRITLTHTPGPRLQRKCACGSHAMVGGECEECSKNKRLGLQTKLTVNEPGEVYEQEADRVADQVMAMPSHAAAAGTPPRIHRLASQPGGQTDAAPLSVDRVLASPGKPLEPALRQHMEQRFGHDFSRVKVHTGTAAEQSARDMNAQAYTVGRDMAFGRGWFAPGTHEGRRLIAHELTHVVQQSGDDGMTVGRSKDKRGLSPIIQGAIAQQSIQRTPLCPDKRDPGEVTKSQSPAGILAVDTGFEPAMERLSVQDFGIDQDSVPPTMTESDDWRRMMSMILGDPTTKVGVLGFSDCIGTEQNNQGLRGRRAEAVVKAMPADAQAKVLFKGWWGSLSYLFPNDTAENRARNRMVQVTLMRSRTDSCDGLAKATNIDQFIFLVSCLEKRLGLTEAADAPKTLSVLRQLYFGNAPWSTERNRSKIWDDIITKQPWAPGDDPTPKLGAKLLSALQASKEVKFDSSASSTSIEVSHLLTGLDAMMNPQITLIKAAGPIFGDTEVFNHALATWAGDVASAAANYTICVDQLKFSASYDDFFKSLAEDADLEGDIDAYAVWACAEFGTQRALSAAIESTGFRSPDAVLPPEEYAWRTRAGHALRDFRELLRCKRPRPENAEPAQVPAEYLSHCFANRRIVTAQTN